MTIRVRRELPSLREKRAFALIRSRLALAVERFETRVVEFSVQSNHVHFIVESANECALAQAMKGLAVRIARGLNRLWNRSGAILDDHYHARAPKTPREVRNALVYVIQNARKHGGHFAGPDPCSSGPAFDGWKDPIRAAGAARASPLGRATTWLLSIGWRKHGLIRETERPAR